MKAILLSLAFAIGIGANAQTADHQQKTAAEKAERRTEKMAKDLQLNAEQKAKVAEINLSYAKAMEQVNTIKDEKSHDMRADVLKGNRDRGYQAALTPEQFKKLLDMRAAKKAKHDAEKKADKKDNDGDDN